MFTACEGSQRVVALKNRRMVSLNARFMAIKSQYVLHIRPFLDSFPALCFLRNRKFMITMSSSTVSLSLRYHGFLTVFFSKQQ